MAKMKSFSEYLNPTPEVIVEDVMKPSLGKSSSTTEQSNFMESFSKNYEAFTQNVEKAEQFIEKFNELVESVKPNENLIERGEVESILATHLLIINQNIQEIKKDLLGINESDLSKITDVISSIDARTETLIEFVQAELPKNKNKLYELSLNLDKKVALLSAEISDVEETTAATFESVSRKLAEAEASTEEQFKLSDEVKVKILAKVNELYEDVHNTNVSISTLSENYDAVLLPAIERINAFEENLTSVDSVVQEYHSSLDKTKEELKQVINEVNTIFINEKYVELDRKVQRIEEIFESVTSAKPLNEEATILTPEELKSKTAEEVEKYLSGKSFQQPNPDAVSTSPEFKNIANKLKFLEQAIGRIAATGPGGGEVNLRYLDDVDRSSIQDGRFLKYDAATKKFVFSAIDLSALNYQGVWDALANSPALATGTGTKGYYYIVGTAGTTALNGISDWKIGDWVVFSGTAWQKIDNTDSVTSVNGQTGPVVLGTMSDQNANAVAITGGTVVAESLSITTNTTPAVFMKDSNLTSWDYSGKSISIGAQELTATGIFFKPDGTEMYIIGQTGDDVTQYTLSTAWDVTTAIFTRVSGTLGESNPSGVFFKPDGTVMYVIGTTTDTVREFSVSTAWDVSTIAFVRSFSVTTQDTTPNDLWFKPDGSKMYIVGSTNDRVYEYNLSTAWDISTSAFLQFFSVGIQDTNPGAVNFNSDGTRMYVLGITGLDINRYSLSTPWDISTAVFFNSFYIGFQETNPNGLFINLDAGVAYVVGTTLDAVFQYDTLTDGVALISNTGLFIDGGLYTNKNLIVTSNARIDGALSVSGTISGPVAATTLSATSTVNLAGATNSVTSLGTAATTGTITVGGLLQTGAITVGQSTSAQTLNLGTGATLTATIKTVNIGTGGVSGSTTNITIGSNVSGATNLTTMYGPVQMGLATASLYALDVGQTANDATIRSFSSGAGAWFMAYSTAGYYAGVKHVGGGGTRSWFSGMGNGLQPYTISMSSDGASNRFFTVDTTGVISLGNIPGTESLRVTSIVNSVNYIQVAGGATNIMPAISAQGSDSSISLSYIAKGSGYHFFYGSDSPQLGIIPTASSVNWIGIAGGASTVAPTVSVNGQEANIGLKLSPKGTGVLTVTSDAVINGLTVGLGGGSVAQNAAFGGVTLPFNTTGNFNVAVGYQSMFYNKIGTSNVGLGYATLFLNTTANQNLAMGVSALTVLTTGVSTFGAITAGSGYTNGTYTAVAMTPVSGATFVTYPTVTVVVAGGVVSSVTLVTAGQGASSLAATSLTVAAALIGGTGSGFSILVGSFVAGANNTAIGYQAGSTLATGSNNTLIGYQATASTTTVSNEVTLGNASITAFRIPGLAITAAASSLTIGSSGTYLNTLQYSQGYYSTLSYIGVTGTGSFAGVQYNATPASGGVSHSFTAYGSPTTQGQNLFLIGSAPQGGISVNYLSVSSNTTGNAPTISVAGSDTNVGLDITSKGFGVVNVNTGTGTVAKFQDRGVTTVNSPFIFRAGLAGTTAGVLTFPVSPMLQTPDTSDFTFNTNAGTGGGQSGSTQVVLGHTNSAVNYLRLTGAATTAAPSISALGSDTHISLAFRTKNAGAMIFTKQRDATVSSTYLFETSGGLTNDAGGGAFWRGFHIGAPLYSVSGVNKFPRMAQYFELQSATDPTYKNAYLTIGNAGGENIEFNFVNEAGGWSFRNGSSTGTDKTFRVATPLITDKNYLQVAGAAVNLVPILSAQGTDTNVSLALQSKGTGAIDLAAGSSGINISNGTSVTSVGISVPAVVGYTATPTMIFSAPTTPGGVTATVSAVMSAWGWSVVQGGTLYAVDDILTLVGGTFTNQVMKYRVTSVSAGGVITGIAVSQYGNYSVMPAMPASMSGGTGSGATFNLTFYIAGTTSLVGGSGYVEQPTITISGTGGGAAYAVIGSGTTIKSLGSSLSLNVSGSTGLMVGASAGGVDYFYVNGGIGYPYFAATGASANVGFTLASKGAGSFNFKTGNSENQLAITHTSGAVNYVNVTGAPTNAGYVGSPAPTISAAGSDANVSLKLAGKGTGFVISSSPVLIQRTYGGASLIGLGGGTAYAVGVSAAGIDNDTIIDATKTGSYTAYSTYPSTAAATFTLSNLTHHSAMFFTLGAGSSITNQYGFRADGSLTAATNNYGFHSGIASAANRYNFYAAGTADNVFVGQTSLGGTAGTEALRAVTTASAVNWLQAAGSQTGGGYAPTLSSQGSDADINLLIKGKGTGSVFIGSVGNAGGASLCASPITSSVNYVQVLGAVASGTLQILASGQSSDIPINLSAKNNSPVYLSNGNGQASRFFGGANSFTIAGAVSGTAPEISVQGTEANIDLKLTPKGTGVLNITAAATPAAAVASTHKIPVKINGVTYYILVSNV